MTRTTLETGWLYLEWGLGPEDAVILCGGYFVHYELGEKSDQFGVKRVKLRLYLVCSAGLGEHEEMLQKFNIVSPSSAEEGVHVLTDTVGYLRDSYFCSLE